MSHQSGTFRRRKINDKLGIEMALPARFQLHRHGPSTAPNLVEIYLDYLCPFSRRAFDRLVDEVVPQLLVAGKHADQVQVIFRQQVQSWHPHATLIHEVALAAEHVLLHHSSNAGAGSKIASTDAVNGFWSVSKALFAVGAEFGDDKVLDMSQRQLYKNITQMLFDHSKELSGTSITQEQFVELLISKKDQGATKHDLTADFKWHLKLSRHNSIHVSPTLLVDGIVEQSYGSTWTVDDWKRLLSEKFGLN